MSEQLIYSNSRTNRTATSFIFILLSLFLFQSCSSFEGEKINASTTPLPTPTIDANGKVGENRGKLEQDQLTNIDKLLVRWKSGSEEDKKLAEKILNEARKEFDAKRFTISGQGFMESVSTYPTVEGLILSGESIVNINIEDQPQSERMEYKISQFKEGLSFLRSAREFAEKTDQTPEINKHPGLDNKIVCLETFLANQHLDDKTKGCEFIIQILKENKIK